MTSRLALEQSSYLRSAKDQPVQWYPWGRDAFERARNENKPILLDIGAVWCHWCHVMDHESYDDPNVAAILNRDFICIKVDRDERPDVDARYQRAVQALTGQGGWPLTAFLTPTGEVFYGGTYFPPDGKYGRPGFVTILTELGRMYRDDPERVAKQAGEISQHLRTVEAEPQRGQLTTQILTQTADAMARQFDFRHGGFGSQPKFPHPGACEFLLARWFDTREAWPREIVDRTLVGMARGGIRDHLGGGFHRYSVDARWIVPHFEKMAYDNSELLRVYIHAATAPPPPGERGQTGEEVETRQLYSEVIKGIVGWVEESMSDPSGGYYASQDADVGPGDDGDYFTWTPDEVRAVTERDEFEVLARYYDVDEAGEMHHNPQKNVLWLKQSTAQIAAALSSSPEEVEWLLAMGREKLRAARQRRPPPFVDQRLYVSWNGMMVSAMIEAAAFLNRPELEEHAIRTLERLLRDAAEPELSAGMRRAPGSSVRGILEDQVFTAHAAMDAYEATGSPEWLRRSAALMEVVWRDYRADDGGLLDIARGRGGEGFLEQEMKPAQDSPTPSPNGVAAIVLSRLAEHTGEARWRERRDELLEAFAGSAAGLSLYGATLLRAIDWALLPPTHVVVVGRDDERTAELRRAARRVYRPRKVVKWLTPDAPTDTLAQPVKAMLDGNAPRAYVCAGAQCAAPVASPEELAETLRTFAVAT
ncbi:MAG: DUF255 domain-containing protein [Gemmatimonadales bacterium]|nr:DUF255 domain-containing protein [Gemmatimonadales bacterium]